MGMQYKLDVIAALKDAGYNTNRIRKEKINFTQMRLQIGMGFFVFVIGVFGFCAFIGQTSLK